MSLPITIITATGPGLETGFSQTQDTCPRLQGDGRQTATPLSAAKDHYDCYQHNEEMELVMYNTGTGQAPVNAAILYGVLTVGWRIRD